MEVGHSARKAFLQATAPGLETVTVRAFSDSEVEVVRGTSIAAKHLATCCWWEGQPVRTVPEPISE